MSSSARTKRSLYMEWAKTHSHAKYNLATSGLIGISREEFPLDVRELDITAPGGYGHAPLLARLAVHTGVPEECIVTAAGTSMANHLAMAAILEPGDEIVLEQPAYGPLLDVANYLGARVKRLPRRFESRFSISLTSSSAPSPPRRASSCSPISTIPAARFFPRKWSEPLASSRCVLRCAF